MLSVNKNTKNQTDSMTVPVKDTTIKISYLKTDKLVIALYMVTDILEKDEPIRNKLRTLGNDIISDIHSLPIDALPKIAQVMSFLEIISVLNLVSNMNCSILKKEFLLLEKSIKDAFSYLKSSNTQMDLSELFKDDISSDIPQSRLKVSFNNYTPIGHKTQTRIGVQKASTLMQALSDKTSFLTKNNFDIIKNKRREDIIKTISIIGNGATIKDIKNNIQKFTDGGEIYSEKTLQRELVSMIKDDVLYKNGEKRWSKYFTKN